jgi:hypothetical protein
MKMKKLIMILIVSFALVSLAWSEEEHRVKKVEVVNQPLNVNIKNQPVEVNLVNHSFNYEYKVLRIEMRSIPESIEAFQDEINTHVSEGWEFVFFDYELWENNLMQIYVAIMKRPIE